MTAIALTVNGRPFRTTVDPRDRLLDVLRDEIGLTGTKEACGIGVCGACTVEIDGHLATACIQLACLVDGSTIRTVEGLATGGQLSPVQRAFAECGALQCGFCTPGQVMAATWLVERSEALDEASVTEFMAGNLCRCTGYYTIVEAVLRASAATRQA